MLKFGEWINRKRHNRGFGIQSPSAFFFITEVLNERLPYYAYRTLDYAIEKCGGMSRKHARELFRITNYMHPANCIAVASESAFKAMQAARPCAPCYSADGKKHGELGEIISKCNEVGILYIGNTPLRDTIIETALQHTNNRSAIIVEGINKDRSAQEWWQGIVEDSRTIVTYDMYSYGILLFDSEKKKQHYKLKR